MSRQARGAASHRRGRSAEALCVWCLRLKGYRILARRYRAPVGEIDLIVRRGRVLAAVEVKARTGADAAAAALGMPQRRRIVRALEHFLQARPELASLAPRFDAMLVTPGLLPRHLVDAWRPGE